MKARFGAVLALIPFAASCNPSAMDLTPCQQDLIAAYFNVVHAPNRGVQGKELAIARHRLASEVEQCAWPASGIDIKWWRNISALEIAIVAHDSDRIRATLIELTNAEIYELKKAGRVESGHPAMIAAAFGNREIMELLISSGLTTRVKDKNGNSPLLLAVARTDRDIELVEVIIRSGADVNEADDHGFTALRTAVYYNDVILVRYLLGQGAKICPGGSGDTSIYDRIVVAEPTELQPLLRKHALSSESGCVAKQGLRELPAADSHR